jgi:hypothetical protein
MSRRLGRAAYKDREGGGHEMTELFQRRVEWAGALFSVQWYSAQIGIRG